MTKTTLKRKRKESHLPEWAKYILNDAKKWCRGRLWWPRLLLLLYMLHIMFSHVKDPMCSDIFKGVDLGFHEMGHVIFAPLGEFMGIAGGSLFQCLVPILSILMFLRQRDYFGIAFCFGWLSCNLFDVATYAADASEMALPLVTPFGGNGEVIHDWNYLLENLNMLQYDTTIANGLRIAAVLSMLFFVSSGFWLIYRMMQSPKVSATKSDLISNSDSNFDLNSSLNSKSNSSPNSGSNSGSNSSSF